MAQLTRKAIINTFQDMLEKMPFNKITVSALVTRCGISPNTFYYHFRNIHDLLECWFRDKLNLYFLAARSQYNWQDPLKACLHRLQSNSQLLSHFSDCLPRDRLEGLVFECSHRFFYDYIRHRSRDAALTEKQIQDTTDLCYYAFFGFLFKFLWTQMDEDCNAAVDRLSELFETFIMRTLPAPHSHHQSHQNSGSIWQLETDATQAC